jgi:hypothetical protein
MSRLIATLKALLGSTVAGLVRWAATRPKAAYVRSTVADYVLTRVLPAPRLEMATHHPMRYYLSLPRGWYAGRTWPVVVTLDGADRDFRWNHRAFLRVRGEWPAIIVTPLVFSPC